MNQPNNAKLEALKKSWQQKKAINDKLDKIGFKIGVYSGKGGVGKTTVAVNLAVSLGNKDKQVGILDTDVDCPNVPKIIGVHQDAIYQNGVITPGQAFGAFGQTLALGPFAGFLSARRSFKANEQAAIDAAKEAAAKAAFDRAMADQKGFYAGLNEGAGASVSDKSREEAGSGFGDVSESGPF